MKPQIRKSVSNKTRFEVFKRDGFTCQYCGSHPPDVLLEADHILPVCEGGTNDKDNLATACKDCNRGKSGVPLSSIPQSLAEKAAQIAEREEQIKGYRAIIQGRLDRIEEDMWEVADLLVPDSSKDGMYRDWLRSIKVFNERLPLHVVLESAEIARARKPYSDRKRFLYFCGICWNHIRAEAEE